MKKQQCARRIFNILAMVLAFSMVWGILAAPPIFAAEENDDLLMTDAEYVILDAEYLNDNLESKHEVSVGKASWNYVDFELMESDHKFVRFNILNKDGQKHNDPYIGLDMNGTYSAEEYKYVTVFVKTDENAKTGVTRDKSVFQMFFQAGAEGGYNEQKSKKVQYVGLEGYQVLTFDFSSNTSWSGAINKLRLDVYSHGNFGEGDYCDIAAIVLNKSPEAVYESAFEVLQRIYPAKQVLSDFKEEELVCFNKGIDHPLNTSDTTVSIKDGSVRYDIESDYNDPFAPFFYKDLMNLRGIPEDQRLTTEDFNFTVMRYRTSPVISSPSMQLFIFAGEHYQPFQVDGRHLSPATSYSATPNNNWRSMVIQMDKDHRTAAGWTGDFNGFRVDWCASEVRDDSYMEISDILFYSSERAANAFVRALNTLSLPIPEETLGHDGSYFKPLVPGDSYSVLWADELNEIIIDSDNTKHVVFQSKGVQTVQLRVAEKCSAPYVELDPDGYSADEYKYITVLVKANAAADPAFWIHYSDQNGEYNGNHNAMSRYATGKDWQVLVFNFSEMTSWSGNIEKLKLEFLDTGNTCAVGTTCLIGGMAFCKDIEAVYDSANHMLIKAYNPVQVLSDFAEDDIPYFQNSDKEGNTALSVENGNLIYTATGEGDPQKTFRYEGYAAKNELKPVTTDVFQYTVVRYRCQGMAANTRTDLYLMTGDAKSLWDMARYDYVNDEGRRVYAIHLSTLEYKCNTTWSAMTFNMAQTDGLEGNVNLMNGWHREDGNTRFQGFRFDWCSTGVIGSRFEMSDMVFFDNADDANAYSKALNSITILPSFTDVVPDDTDHGGEDITEESDTETEIEDTSEESIPEFDDSEETTEEIPEFPNDSEGENSESEVEITTETEEADTEDTESSTPSDDSETESEDSATESDNESDSGEDDGSRPNNNWLDDGDDASNAPGSQAPFVIACICLAGLSVASIVTVGYIRLKERRTKN